MRSSGPSPRPPDRRHADDPAGTGWSAYVARFHEQRPGITEDVLAHATDAAGATPYAWAATAVPSGSTVLDLACGSGPMAGRLPRRRYVGLDASTEELRVAAARGLAVARADAGRLPLADASVDAVVVSMALMLLPLSAALAEVGRVLRPGGVLVATVPTNRPLPWRDWLRYARLCLALRHWGLAYPNDHALRSPAAVLGAAGLRVVSDEATGFRCDLTSADLAEQVVASLYLPRVSPRRLAAGRNLARGWAGTSLTTPIRRLVAERAAGS